MSWLPAMRFAGNRYWLPLSRPAADLVAAVLVEQPAAEGSLVRDLAARLRIDPPLAICAALRIVPNCPAHHSAQSVGLSESASPAPATSSASRRPSPHGVDRRALSLEWLAQELAQRIPAWFATGDAFLGAPEDRGQFVSKWLALQAAFAQLPHSKWLASADQWLEITGPPVPATVRQRWPRLTDLAAELPRNDELSHSHFDELKLDLCRLARRLRRERRLTGAFSDALGEAKQASLKQLAYGLSHEINNPLAGISLRAQGLMRDEQQPDRSASLQRIVDQAMRAHEMVADLMFFSHPPAPHRVTIDLADILSRVAKQIRPAVAERGIELHVNRPDAAVTVTADPSMMTEAVRALIRNSIEAIGCDGRVDLECRRQEGKPASAVVFVRDSGPGLSAAARVHAFDPYFSGREAGRGLGVGLCRVKRIAQIHGGGVSLVSGPAGCTARLWIPAQA